MIRIASILIVRLSLIVVRPAAVRCSSVRAFCALPPPFVAAAALSLSVLPEWFVLRCALGLRSFGVFGVHVKFEIYFYNSDEMKLSDFVM